MPPCLQEHGRRTDIIPAELGSIIRHLYLTKEEENKAETIIPCSLNLIGFKVSSWDVQQAGLAKGEVQIDDDMDIITGNGMAILDQEQQLRVRRRKLIAMAAGVEKLTDNMPLHKVIDHLSKPLTFGKAQIFPTDCRPIQRLLASEDQATIYEWFTNSQISVGELNSKQQHQVERLLYTWRDIFTDDMLQIKECDLVEHAIDIKPGSRPVKARTPLYTEEEIAFLARLIPAMEKAGLIARCDSPWMNRTKYPPRKKSDPSKGLRQVYNFIPINKVTVKSFYPSPRIEQITHNMLKNEMQYYSWFDVANAYWSVPLR